MGSTTKSDGGSVTQTSMPGINDVLGTAKTVFNNGAAWAPNTTSMVTPFSKQTQYGLSSLENVARGSADALRQNFNRVNSVVGDGGLNDLQDQQVSRLQGIAGGNGLNDMQQNAASLTSGIANGQPGQNPYLDEVIRRTSEDIGNSTNLMASAAGRYGSGAHQGVLNDSVGDMSANLRYQDYGQQQARQDNAIQNLFNMGQTGFGQRQDAIGSLWNAGSTQRANQLAGTQQLQDAYQARMDPFQTMLGVGGQYENKNQQVLQDKNRIVQERKDALTGPVEWINALARGYQQGTQVKNNYSPGGSPIGDALSTYGLTHNPFLSLLAGGSSFF